MSYISNRLVHWVGRGKHLDEQYRLLTRCILQQKRLMFGKCPWDFGSKYGGLKEREGEEGKNLAICFADIPFSETKAHCTKYSKFGISFDKSYLANCLACPVGYVQNRIIHANFSHIYEALKAVEKQLPKVTVDSAHHVPKVVTVDQILSWFMYMIAFAKNYSREEYTYNEEGDKPLPDQKEFFEDVEAWYFEREWRMVLSSTGERHPWITPREGEPAFFEFKEQYMGPIIMPREYIINHFNKDREEVFRGYDEHWVPTVLAYEDLQSM